MKNLAHTLILTLVAFVLSTNLAAASPNSPRTTLLVPDPFLEPAARPTLIVETPLPRSEGAAEVDRPALKADPPAVPLHEADPSAPADLEVRPSRPATPAPDSSRPLPESRPLVPPVPELNIQGF